MRLPVAVYDGHSLRHVETSGLSFSRTAPGGDERCQATIHHDEGALANLGSSDRLLVMDPETGRVAWSGYCEHPEAGRTRTSVTAQGGWVLTTDQTDPVIYKAVPQRMDEWRITDQNYANASAADVNDTVRLHISPGAPIATSQGIHLAYEPGRLTGQKVKQAVISVKSGADQTGWRHRIAPMRHGARDYASGTSAPLAAAPMTVTLTPGAGVLATLTGVAWSLYRSGPATSVIAEDSIWSELAAPPEIWMETLTATGITASYPGAPQVSHVVTDVIGRWLNRTVKPGVIDTAAPLADRLAWPEGINAKGVLDALLTVEASHTWMVGPIDPTDWKHPLHYRPWGTTPRYEVETYTPRGALVERCNRVRVSWTDAKGVRQSKLYTTPIPELDAVGRTRDAATVELPEGLGSETLADTAAAAAFAEVNTESPAGTANTDLVRDLATGAMLRPWMVEPGHLVRVREMGTTLRLTRTEYDAERGQVELTLGTPA